jgi:uncharacterized protein (TIGR02145 family)
MISFRIRSVLNFLVITLVFIIIFPFSSCKKEEERIMKVRNDSISDVSITSAKAFATIIDIGSGIDQHGHCWSTSAELNIDVNENKSELGPANNTGPFTSIMTGLLPNTKYYFRAYVKKSSTVAYGNDILSFNTLSLGKPAVTTGTVTNLTESGATVTGNLTSLGEGALSVTQHGHCWSSETTTPVIEDDSKSSLGSTDKTGNYESSLIGLSESTVYYVRAYATNDAGTTYGDTITFKTYRQIIAEFYGTPTSGYLPLSVQFTDRSAGDINSWSWDFGDGGTSSEEDPLYTYNEQGVYSVTLTVSNNIGSDSEIKTNYISVSASGTAPDAGFTADQTSIIVEETVNFTDQSINDPTSWSWNFGDGGTSTEQNPSHQFNTEGVFTVSMSATNSYGTDTETKNNYITVESKPPETVTDYDGNEYNTIQIGGQLWMAENLATTHYSNGTALVDGSGAGDINGDFTTKYYFAPENNESNVPTYGRLYTWAAIMNGASTSNSNPSGVQGVCPSGWHVPSDSEWKELEMFLGMSQSAADATDWRGTDEGGKLKHAGTTYWLSPNTGATNESGFTALPAGGRDASGNFSNVGYYTDFWTTREYIDNTEGAWYRLLQNDASAIYRTAGYKPYATSVRCIKDD